MEELPVLYFEDDIVALAGRWRGGRRMTFTFMTAEESK
jgi:hypothetical protein